MKYFTPGAVYNTTQLYSLASLVKKELEMYLKNKIGRSGCDCKNCDPVSNIRNLKEDQLHLGKLF